MLFLSSTPHGLPPRSTGQWLAASTAPLRSTPALYSASYSLPFPPSLDPSLLPSPARCPLLRLLFYVLYNASPHLVRLFFPSFVRVTLAEAARRGVSETLMRDSSSFLVSSLRLPIRFLSLFRSRPHPRQDTRALLSFPRLRPFPFSIRRVSTVNRYFRSDAFRLSIVVPLSHTLSGCVAPLSSSLVLFSTSLTQDVNLQLNLKLTIHLYSLLSRSFIYFF